jgi:hypothetical protein
MSQEKTRKMRHGDSCDAPRVLRTMAAGGCWLRCQTPRGARAKPVAKFGSFTPADRQPGALSGRLSKLTQLPKGCV